MPTRIGQETDPIARVEHLVALDFDAIEAYSAAIERLEDTNSKATLEQFKNDHLRHVRELEKVLGQVGGNPPKSLLTAGVALVIRLHKPCLHLSASLSPRVAIWRRNQVLD